MPNVPGMLTLLILTVPLAECHRSGSLEVEAGVRAMVTVDGPATAACSSGRIRGLLPLVTPLRTPLETPLGTPLGTPLAAGAGREPCAVREGLNVELLGRRFRERGTARAATAAAASAEVWSPT